MRPIIRVENLGKQFRIGARKAPYATLRETLTDAVRSPLRWLRREGDASANTHWALKDLSFDIMPGEAVGVIGRNGAGKSTLLKVLSRITEPTEGQVELYGRVGSLLEVGTGFHHELTGRENVFLSGAILGMKRAEIRRQFDEIVGFAEVDRFIDTPIKHYSSGMQMRLAFAVAAHLDPEILVVDEVLAVGDANFQKKVLGKMSGAIRGGRTVLFVSHNQGAVQNLCTRALLLNQGRLEFAGDVDKAFVRYAGLSGHSAVGTADLTWQRRDPRFQRRHAQLQALTLRDGAGNPAETLLMGQPCSFVLDVDFLQTGGSYEIGVAIASFHGVQVHYLISTWEGFDTITRTGPHRIECRLPELHLFPGNYQVCVWVKKEGAIHDDEVDQALNFRVEEGQFTRGQAYFSRYSLNTQVYVSSDWSFLDTRALTGSDKTPETESTRS